MAKPPRIADQDRGSGTLMAAKDTQDPTAPRAGGWEINSLLLWGATCVVMVAVMVAQTISIHGNLVALMAHVDSLKDTFIQRHAQPAVQNVLTRAGVQCSSTETHGKHSCERLYDGRYSAREDGSWAAVNPDTGSWIELTLDSEFVLTSMEIWGRCVTRDQYSGVLLIFSDHSATRANLTCYDGTVLEDHENCDRLSADIIDLRNVSSRSVRLEFEAVCSLVKGAHPGIREIVLKGYKSQTTQ